MLLGYADYPDMGPTHAELNWKLIAPCFNNLKVFFPTTLAEAKKAFQGAYEYQGPSLLILKKALI